jgi:hypothetical protein
MLSADIARRRMPNTIPKRCPGPSWTTKTLKRLRAVPVTARGRAAWSPRPPWWAPPAGHSRRRAGGGLRCGRRHRDPRNAVTPPKSTGSWCRWRGRSGSESSSRQPATKRRQILAQLPYDELSSTTLNCVDSLSAHGAKPGSRHLGQAFPDIQPFKILADASIVGLMWEVSLLKIGPRSAGSRCRLIRGRRALTPRTDRRRRCATIDSQDRRAGSDASTA